MRHVERYQLKGKLQFLSLVVSDFVCPSQFKAPLLDDQGATLETMGLTFSEWSNLVNGRELRHILMPYPAPTLKQFHQLKA